ncbi:hypothetical protein PGIGA_G00238980 [Pangasianodon gigas]|uniref:Uncharacterized protein n=1 Tax=Pangasianodon gigas TaxID=30993 RepID=A0ACC5WNX5_PANGG|nr:hypothetical protein [Pangasianodon gigas]
MACARRMKTLASTCVILSGMTNIACLLYVGWITNFVHEKDPERKLEEDKGETLRIIERLERLENVVNSHIQERPQRDDAADLSLSDSPLFLRWGRDLGPESRHVALRKFQYYGYNAYLSDRLSLDRAIPDLRPDGCKNISYHASLPQVSIVFIFVDEALSVILRSVHSAMRRTPSHLLREIILVDDSSSNVELRENLQRFVEETNQRRPDFIKMVRHTRQEGLIRARVSGWRAASAPVVALFDAHVEFNVGWAEPILHRIQEDRRRVISPSFDNIKYDTFEVDEYPLSAHGFDWELWCRYLNPPRSWWSQKNHTAPIRIILMSCDDGPAASALKALHTPRTPAARVLNGQRHLSTSIVVDSAGAHGCKAGRHNYTRLAANDNDNKSSPSSWFQESIKGRSRHKQRPTTAPKTTLPTSIVPRDRSLMATGTRRISPRPEPG